MRNLTTAQRAVYESSGATYATHFRAFISNDYGTTWLNLRSLVGLDFLAGVTWEETIDAGVGEAHLILVRQQGPHYSLAPDMTQSVLNNLGGSFEPLLRRGVTWVKIQVAPVPSGTEPEEGQYLTAWEGVVQGIADSGSELLDVFCRDHTVALLLSWIRSEYVYGADSGVPVEQVMSQIISNSISLPSLDTLQRWKPSTHYPAGARILPSMGLSSGWVPTTTSGGTSGSSEPLWPPFNGATVADGTVTWTMGGPYLLYTPTSPTWLLGPYKQDQDNCYKALETLAMQIGWYVRQRWDDGTGKFRLTFYSPNRDQTDPDYVLTEYQQRDVPGWGGDIDDLRNVVQVTYLDKLDLDAAGHPRQKTVLVRDTDSIAEYGGEYFMNYTPAAAGNIDTEEEATRLANSALSDLSQPMVDVQVECPFMHHLEIGDLVQVPPDGAHHDVAQNLSVVSLSHKLSDMKATTTLSLRGKPMVARKQWIVRQAAKGNAALAPDLGPQAVTGLTVTPTTAGLVVDFTAPVRGPVATEFELHLSDSPGFAPSDATFYAKSNSSTFTVTDLPAGATKYAVVVPRAAAKDGHAGLPGEPSVEAEVTTRYVEPRILQPFVEVGSLIPNDSFEAANDPAAPPDTWTLLTGTWGTTATRVTSDAMSGRAGVKFIGSTSNTLASRYITARPLEVYSAEVWAKRTAVTGSNVASLLVDFVDVDFAVIGTVLSVTVNPVVADDWRRFFVVSAAPSGTRYVRVRLNQGSSTPDDILWDSVRLREVRVLMEQLSFPDGVTTAFANNFDNVSSPGGTYTRLAWYKGADDRVCLQGRIYRTSGGTPSAGTAIVTGLPTPYRPAAETTCVVATDSGYGVVTITAAGSIVYQAGGVGWLSLDNISFRGSPG